LFLITAVQVGRNLSAQNGIRRLELQYLALSCGLGAILSVSFNALGNYLHVRALNRASIVVVIIAYLFMAWALAHHRIFNARHVLVTILHRLSVVGALAILAWAMASGLAPFLDPTAAWVVGVLLGGMAVFWLDHASRTWLGLSDEQLLATVRGEVIAVSQRVTGATRTTAGFEELLATHHQAGFAAIMSRHGERYVGNGLEFPSPRSGFATLCDCAWITPESLQRRRSNPGLEDLGAYLEENSIGVLVTVPRGSPAPTMLVAVGIKQNEWPYTYPEVRRLQNVAELMDSILTRTRLTDQVALQTRMEHLAMMSRGLAHDLKNLLTPISSFLIHTDGRFPAGSAEAEVHAAARRSSRIITEYVREALFFSERLAPKFEIVDVARVLEAALEANAPRAKPRGIILATDLGPVRPVTADAILLQRMLANLVGNAIDASAPGQTVRLAAQAIQPGWLRLQVSDQGSGIAPEKLERIFEPYFTTKEFGEDVRGFGLGLTIAQKIAQLHGGTIAVKSEPGRGTVMTVDLPEIPGVNPAPAA
jgi:signal transduction histidine kinase